MLLRLLQVCLAPSPHVICVPPPQLLSPNCGPGYHHNHPYNKPLQQTPTTAPPPSPTHESQPCPAPIPVLETCWRGHPQVENFYHQLVAPRLHVSGDQWVSLSDMVAHSVWTAWNEHTSSHGMIQTLLAHGAAVDDFTVHLEPDAESLATDHEDDEDADRGSSVHNNFETWLHATGHTQAPQLLALYKAKTLQRLVRFWHEDLGSMVETYLARTPPIHVGMVTSPAPTQAYLYFVIPDWSLGSRIQADLLGFTLLHKLAANPAVQAAARHLMVADVELKVTWCTHKYRLDEDGERQEAKGSGNRTHFYLAAIGPLGSTREPEHEPPRRRSGVNLVHVYHTTMWFEGTYPPAGGPCLSSRLLLRWSNAMPANMFHLASEVWTNLPSQAVWNCISLKVYFCHFHQPEVLCTGSFCPCMPTVFAPRASTFQRGMLSIAIISPEVVPHVMFCMCSTSTSPRCRLARVHRWPEPAEVFTASQLLSQCACGGLLAPGTGWCTLWLGQYHR